MNGPSTAAIRAFKLKQEQEKREQDEKRFKEKLSTLEHRAAQGDRKAKGELKKIEKIKEEGNRPPEIQSHYRYGKSVQNAKSKVVLASSSKSGGPIKRPARAHLEDKFEDLMNMAKQNTNLPIRKPEEPKSKAIPKLSARKRDAEQRDEKAHDSISRQRFESSHSSFKHRNEPLSKNKVESIRSKSQVHSNSTSRQDLHYKPQSKGETSQKFVKQSQPPNGMIQRPPGRPLNRPPDRHAMYRQSMPPRPQQYRRSTYYHDDEYDDEDDEYESDGFVVDDEDDDVQNEVSRTIRSVFKYDKRRCDLREEELERQYRLIGRVNTFEDLEREERRASKLAAQEDAIAQKEEEERKRKKKLRLNRPEGRFHD